MSVPVREIAAFYRMQPHPEGGYYVSTYRAGLKISPSGFPGDRPVSTAILFLLEAGSFSAFHRLRSDECWHFYEGQALLIHQISPDGIRQTTRLGPVRANGEIYQHVVPAGYWFASEPAPGTAYSLVGCTVSPGFDFADFEMADKDILAGEFPGHSDLICRLCR